MVWDSWLKLLWVWIPALDPRWLLSSHLFVTKLYCCLNRPNINKKRLGIAIRNNKDSYRVASFHSIICFGNKSTKFSWIDPVKRWHRRDNCYQKRYFQQLKWSYKSSHSCPHIDWKHIQSSLVDFPLGKEHPQW